MAAGAIYDFTSLSATQDGSIAGLGGQSVIQPCAGTNDQLFNWVDPPQYLKP